MQNKKKTKEQKVRKQWTNKILPAELFYLYS